MGFEKTILNKVSEVINQERKACFYNGSLFVECTAAQAAMVETALIEITRSGVIVSKMQDEFIFDFVA
jgi:hypothetical protein